ncbi:hypothetical protein [Citrifermentans bremense]|uniref:hypothetical protein n=1 Tax=Citrifermentans bremense TaxID=60035 RepID=UPI00040EF3BA|nr:hypothetical protein [Citrifermentans bremense]
MSMKTVACAAALAVLMMQSAEGAAPIPTSMAGNVSCAGFLKARMEKKSFPFEQWLSGYLTGLATYDRRINNVSKLQAANDDPGMQLIESYCKVHPQETFRAAATEMARTIFYRAAK